MAIEYGKAPAHMIDDITVFHTTIEWITLDPIISKGTFCIEEMKDGYYSLKIADGINKWSLLNSVLSADAPTKSYSGTILAGTDTVTVPWNYDTTTKNILVFLGGVKQNSSTLTVVDSDTFKLAQTVPIDTDINVILLPESLGNMISSKGYNYIIDGRMNLWDLGTTTTFTGSTGTSTEKSRISNMLIAMTSGTVARTFTRQSFAIGEVFPDGTPTPTYYSRTQITNSGATNLDYVVQRHDIEDVTKFAGKTVTVRFKARGDNSNNKIAVETLLVGDNGGSTVYNSNTVQTIQLSTKWQSYTLTYTLPSDSTLTITNTALTSLSVHFWFDAGPGWNTRCNSLGRQTGTFDLADVSLVIGDESVFPIERPDYIDYVLSLRYFYYNSSKDNAWARIGFGRWWSNSVCSIDILLPVPMRIKDPIFTIVNVGSLYALDGSNNQTLAALGANGCGDATNQYVQLAGTTNQATAVTGNPALVYAANMTDAAWYLDARY